jgi:hypothetical protein
MVTVTMETRTFSMVSFSYKFMHLSMVLVVMETQVVTIGTWEFCIILILTVDPFSNIYTILMVYSTGQTLMIHFYTF